MPELFDDLVPASGAKADALFADLIPAGPAVDQSVLDANDARARAPERRDPAFFSRENLGQLGAEVREGARGFAQAGRAAELAADIRRADEFEAQAASAEAQGDITSAEQYRAAAEAARTGAGKSAAEIAASESASTFRPRAVVERISNAKTFGEAWQAFKTDPVGAIAGVTAQSAPMMAPALAIGLLNPAAGAVAMGATSAGVEFGSTILDYARDSGIDTREAQALQVFLSDPENLREALARGGKRAGIIGTLDAVSGGMAGKTLAPARIAGRTLGPMSRQAVNVPTQMTTQAILGAGGEAGGQLATEGRITKPGDVFLEAAAEFGGAPVEVAAFGRDLRRARVDPMREERITIERVGLNEQRVRAAAQREQVQRAAETGAILNAPTADAAIDAATRAVGRPNLAAAEIERIAGEDAAIRMATDAELLKRIEATQEIATEQGEIGVPAGDLALGGVQGHPEMATAPAASNLFSDLEPGVSDETRTARASIPARVSDLAGDEAALPQPAQQAVLALRREGDRSLSAVARELQDVSVAGPGQPRADVRLADPARTDDTRGRTAQDQMPADPGRQDTADGRVGEIDGRQLQPAQEQDSQRHAARPGTAPASGDILARNGKPWRSRNDADLKRRNLPKRGIGYEVVPVRGGFAIRPTARPRAVPARARPQREVMPFGEQRRREFLRTLRGLGGVSSLQISDTLGERNYRRMPGLFRRSGRQIDELVHDLTERGYLPHGTDEIDGAEQVRAMIRDAVAGEAVMTLADLEEQARIDFERELAAQSDFTADEVGRALDLMPDDIQLQEIVEAFEAEPFLRDNGISDEAAIERIVERAAIRAESGESYEQAVRDEATAYPARLRGQGREGIAAGPPGAPAEAGTEAREAGEVGRRYSTAPSEGLRAKVAFVREPVPIENAWKGLNLPTRTRMSDRLRDLRIDDAGAIRYQRDGGTIVDDWDGRVREFGDPLRAAKATWLDSGRVSERRFLDVLRAAGFPMESIRTATGQRIEPVQTESDRFGLRNFGVRSIDALPEGYRDTSRWREVPAAMRDVHATRALRDGLDRIIRKHAPNAYASLDGNGNIRVGGGVPAEQAKPFFDALTILADAHDLGIAVSLAATDSGHTIAGLTAEQTQALGFEPYGGSNRFAATGQPGAPNQVTLERNFKGARLESRAEAQAATLAADHARTLLRNALGDAAERIELRRRGEIPEGAEALRTGVEGFYEPKSDRVVIFADAIGPLVRNGRTVLTAEQRLAWVAAHELVHRGVAVKGSGDFLLQLKELGKNETVARLAEAIAAEREGLPRPVAIEEALAEIGAAAETGAYEAIQARYGVDVPTAMRDGLRGAVARFVAAVRRFLSQVIGKESALKLSNADIRNLVRDLSAAGRSEELAGSSAERRFSRNPLNRFDLPSETSFQAVRRRMQDYLLRLKVVQDVIAEQGGTVGVAQDAYRAEERMHGRIQAQLEAFKADRMRPLMDKLAKAGLTPDQLALFAYAKHAPERNAHIASRNPELAGNGSGMTDLEAADVLDRFQRDGVYDALEDAHADLMAITRSTRRKLLEAGLISQGQFDAWERMFQHYVPLRGLEEVTFDAKGKPKLRARGGIDVRGEEARHAEGRTSQAARILENVILDQERAIVRAERKAVAKAFLDLVTTNPDPTLWEVDARKRPAEPEAQLPLPDIEQALRVPKPEDLDRGDETIGLKVGGQPVYVRIHDPLLVRAMQRAYLDETGDLQRVIAEQVGWYNSWLRNTLTRWNPAFVLVNTLRDAQTGAISTLDTLGWGATAKYAKHFSGAMAASWRNERGKLHPQRREWDRWFTEYKAAGGITGGFFMRDASDVFNELRSEVLDASGTIRTKGTGAGRLADKAYVAVRGTKAGRLAAATLHFVEMLGGASENAARLAAFRTAREMGKSVAEAASIAKNLTVNFNRKGEWGTAMNALYLFYNASVQGSVRVAQALKNPRVQAAMAGLSGLSFALALGNAQWGGEDDDGESNWDKVPDYVKERNLVILLPPSWDVPGINDKAGQAKYLKIPLPYGFSVFAVLGNVLADVMRNRVDPKQGITPTKGAIALVSAVAGSFNPVGGSFDPTEPVQLGLAAAPTFLDLPIQLATETNSFGRPTAPARSDWDARPDSERYFLGDAGNLQQRIAQWLNQASGGDRARSGAIDVTPGTIATAVRGATGGLGTFMGDVFTTAAQFTDATAQVNPANVPFFKSIYGQADNRTDQAKFYDNRRAIEQKYRQNLAAMKMGIDVDLSNPENKAVNELGETMVLTSRFLSQLRKDELAVIENPKLTDSAKRLERERIDSERTKLMRAFNKTFNDTYKPAREGKP